LRATIAGVSQPPVAVARLWIVRPPDHFMRILKRILNVIEGVVFILLSLCFQAIFLGLLTMAVLSAFSAVGLEPGSRVLENTVFFVLFVAINALACWEYFRKQRAQVGLGKTSSVIFMIPRALDLIWNGSERITR
jgi:hypothetical protein